MFKKEIGECELCGMKLKILIMPTVLIVKMTVKKKINKPLLI